MSNGRPRRRSIFSGLLLIVLGVLFLMNSFVPGLGVWDLVGRYWPVVLILWGLAKLYDHLASRRAGETPPPAMTGSEFALLVFVLIFGGAILLIKRTGQHGPDWEVSLPWDRSFSLSEELPAKAVKPDAQIGINTERGDVVVHPEETTEIRVVVKKTATASNEEEAKRRAQQVTVAIQEVSGGYEVKPQMEGDMGVRVDLEVHVPKQCSIRAKTAQGDVHVSGVAGPVTVTSSRGDIEVRDAGGDVTAELRRGDLHISSIRGNLKLTGRGSEVEIADVAGEAMIEGEFYGPIRIKNVAKGTRYISQRTDLTVGQLTGRMEMSSGKLELYDAPGNVSLVTRNKDVVMENVSGRIRIESRHGDVEVRFEQPPREEVDIANDSGSVDLVLPEKSSFELAAVSRSGEVESDFHDPTLKESQENDTGKLEGKRGTRGPQIRLKTSYGTIRLRRAS